MVKQYLLLTHQVDVSVDLSLLTTVISVSPSLLYNNAVLVVVVTIVIYMQ